MQLYTLVLACLCFCCYKSSLCFEIKYVLLDNAYLIHICFVRQIILHRTFAKQGRINFHLTGGVQIFLAGYTGALPRS